MVKLRRTMFVTPKFLERLKKLQGKIKSQNGNEPSLAELAERISESPVFNDIENQIINSSNMIDLKFKIKFDRDIG